MIVKGARRVNISRPLPRVCQDRTPSLPRCRLPVVTHSARHSPPRLRLVSNLESRYRSARPLSPPTGRRRIREATSSACRRLATSAGIGDGSRASSGLLSATSARHRRARAVLVMSRGALWDRAAPGARRGRAPGRVACSALLPTPPFLGPAAPLCGTPGRVRAPRRSPSPLTHPPLLTAPSCRAGRSPLRLRHFPEGAERLRHRRPRHPHGPREVRLRLVYTLR